MRRVKTERQTDRRRKDKLDGGTKVSGKAQTMEGRKKEGKKRSQTDGGMGEWIRSRERRNRGRAG